MSNDLLVRIGKKIQDLRASKDWSLRKLGAEIDDYPSLIGRMERGEQISIVVLEKIANCFQLDISYFFVDDNINLDNKMDCSPEWMVFIREVEEKHISLSQLRELIQVIEKINNGMNKDS